MKIYKNEQGQDCYELTHITDLALLPSSAFEQALGQVKFFLTNLRVIIAAVHADGHLEEFLAVLPELPLTFVDDGETWASFTAGEDQTPIYTARMKTEGE